VHLHQVQPVRAEPAQALLDPGPDVAGAVGVRERWRGAGRRVTEQAPAFGRQEILAAPVAEIPADQFLAPAVIGRCVDQADPAVEYRVQQPPGLLVVYRRPVRRTALS
jgi:hypothetical protein